jgi:hypothetical protein
MKVYVVFWSDGTIDVMDKVFSGEEKARRYIAEKNKTTDLGWAFEEAEVEE